jgi:hypothetical protein
MWFLTLAAGVLAGPGMRADEKPRTEAKIVVDVSGAPQAKAWADKAKSLCQKWYPIITDYLGSKGFTPPQTVKLVFKNMRGIAGTSGDTITISAKWIADHPGDFGMVIHELTHVVQSYPHFDRKAGWLVEGIADYIRYYRFEPGKKKLVVNPRRVSYRNGYHPAAAFLDWVQRTYDKRLVNQLNAALRAGTYKEEIFKQRTAKNLDTLWKEFVKTVLEPAGRKKQGGVERNPPQTAVEEQKAKNPRENCHVPTLTILPVWPAPSRGPGADQPDGCRSSP